MNSTALPVLVFDGDCGFCTSSARWAVRRLHLAHVAPWQSLDLEPLGLTQSACQAAVQWVGADGSVVSAERAVIAALRHAGGFWRLVGLSLAVPGIRHVSGIAYRLVAHYRYRLPGGTPACRI